MEILSVGADFFMQTEGRTDGQTDRGDEANNRLPQFCEGV